MSVISNPENKMGVLPVKKLLFTMSIPPMLSMLLNSLYNIVDSVFVSMVSQDALTAVSLVFPVQMLMIAINVGLGIGLSSVISRRLGEGSRGKADSTAAHGFILTACCAVIYAIFGVFGAGPFLRLFTSDADIYGMALVYCQFVTIGSVFICFSIYFEKILQATGNMLQPMIFNAIGAAVNVVLDPILIFGLLGAPKMGVMGAAVATIAGQAIGAAVAAVMFLKRKQAVAVRLRGFRYDGKTVSNILAVGIPSVIMISIQSFLVGGLNAMLMGYSTVAVAVLGIYFRVQTFVILPAVGMTQGAMPIIGYNFGANNRVRVMATFKLALKVAAVVMLLGAALFWILPAQIMSLFNADGELLDMGVYALRVIGLAFIPAAVGIVSSTFFQAVGHGFYSMMISIVRQLAVILPLAYVLLIAFGIGGVWYSFLIAEIPALVMSFLFMRSVYKQQIEPMPEGNPAG
jgi:putative MATE family efflux protein